MKSVRYLKVVLTVIAACLALICLRDISLVRTASAKTDGITGRYQMVMVTEKYPHRIDTSTGEICIYNREERKFWACAE